MSYLSHFDLISAVPTFVIIYPPTMAAPTQQLPSWLSASDIVVDGQTETTLVYIPLTYFGPSVCGSRFYNWPYVLIDVSRFRLGHFLHLVV